MENLDKWILHPGIGKSETILPPDTTIKDILNREIDKEMNTLLRSNYPWLFDTEVKYFYLRNKDDNHSGFTFAYWMENGYYHVAVAQCGKKDNFCKRIGRDIASGRLITGRIKFRIPIPGYDHKPTSYLMGWVEKWMIS